MPKVIRISEPVFQRLQKLAEPFVDTPGSVIEGLLDFYESQHRAGQQDGTRSTTDAGEVVRLPRSPKTPGKYPSLRPSRQKGVTVMIEEENQTFRAESVRELYRQVLGFICNHGYIDKLQPYIPLKTSGKRYLIAMEPIHPNGNSFIVPVEYRGYFMESHKDYKNGVNHLAKMLRLCGLTLQYLGY